ncbi:MAG: arginine--tRNA ligase [Candidatus Marinimicrobia bacterium]|nr:arginine--tRNA ligase [Candidatus Neomarinimicrobiota bacterium]
MTIEQRLSAWMAAAFARAGVTEAAHGSIGVRRSQNEAFGDYQCEAALKVARALGQPPRVLAAAVQAQGTPPGCEPLAVAGPGFLNLRLSTAGLEEALEAQAADERLGTPPAGAGRTVVLDYSSPNVAKPMHIGHIRSTVIGNALDRLFRFLGYRVIADNHVGDWGTQFGLLILGYRQFLEPAALQADPIAELERLYRLSYERSRAEPEWLAAARAELVKLQAGDADNLALWRQFVAWSRAEFQRVYERLDVHFDLERGESYYNDKLPGVLERLAAAGVLEASEGAQIVRLEAEQLGVCIVRKSDGGYNYATTDLATVLNRIDEFNPTEIVYVTDERQQLHFNQIFAVARRLGVATTLRHVWFGLMRLPEGTFSTREGNVIKLERLLDEAESRALALVQAGSPELPAETQAAIARAVGLGAVKYADLSQNPQSLVTFTWEKALALEGNSAPYLQYAHARIRAVQDKYRERFPHEDPARFPLCVREPAERRLALRLLQFPDALLAAAAQTRPNLIADALYDLAQTYSSFYQTLPFLKAPAGIRESRLRLCDLTARVLKQGLNLLGIAAPDRI